MTARAFLALGLFLVASGPAPAQPDTCGVRPNDWCASPVGDPCGRHKTAAACKADRACHGMLYRGESVIACLWDSRGFAPNCPTVGCISAPKR